MQALPGRFSETTAESEHAPIVHNQVAAKHVLGYMHAAVLALECRETFPKAGFASPN